MPRRRLPDHEKSVSVTVCIRPEEVEFLRGYGGTGYPQDGLRKIVREKLAGMTPEALVSVIGTKLVVPRG